MGDSQIINQFFICHSITAWLLVSVYDNILISQELITHEWPLTNGYKLQVLPRKLAKENEVELNFEMTHQLKKYMSLL